jgi:tetratricopeptide (TPR) repeat protein
MALPTLLLCLAVSTFQTFAILGTVRDDQGHSLPAIRVSLTDDNGQTIRTLLTDSTGRFQVRGLTSGRYSVRVEPAGKPFEERSIQLDLQALRVRRGGGEEQYPVEIILKRKGSGAGPAPPGVVFAQKVPDPAKAEYEKGANSLKDNKSDLGIASLQKAIEIFPDYYLALELLGTEYVKRGEYQNAMPVLTHAIDLNSSAPRSLYAIGVAQMKLNMLVPAIESLKKAADLDSGNVNVQMMLGIALGTNGELSESETALKKAYALGGDQVADVHLYLAGIYNKQQRYPEAIKELELYLKEAKDLKDRAPIRAMIDRIKEKQKKP